MEPKLHWIDSHLLACPVKAIGGFDCPGCGFQRAGIALLRGDLATAWEHYPPLLPFLATLVLLLIALRTKYRFRMQALAVGVATTCIFIAVNYAYKIF